MPPTIPIHEQSGTLRFLTDHDDLWEPTYAAIHAGDLEEAREAVRRIAEILAGHMLVEEGPAGVFDAMAAANPALEGSLARLHEDHERLRSMLAEARASEGSPGERDRIREFGRFLEVHEIREKAALELARRAEGTRKN